MTGRGTCITCIHRTVYVSDWCTHPRQTGTRIPELLNARNDCQLHDPKPLEAVPLVPLHRLLLGGG